MWKLLPVLFLLTSCSAKIVYVSIENHSGQDTQQELSADAASLTTETDQTTDGNLEIPLP